jgi:hypothetical protein
VSLEHQHYCSRWNDDDSGYCTRPSGHEGDHEYEEPELICGQYADREGEPIVGEPTGNERYVCMLQPAHGGDHNFQGFYDIEVAWRAIADAAAPQPSP